MKITGNYYNYNDRWSVLNSMLRPESFVDIEEAEYLLVSTYDLVDFDVSLLQKHDLQLIIDCSTEIAPPTKLLKTLPIIEYTIYCNFIDPEFVYTNMFATIIVEPFFIKYNNYYRPEFSDIELEKKKFLYMVGKCKAERVCLLGLLSHYNLLDDAYYSFFGDGTLNFGGEKIDNYFNLDAPNIQKNQVKRGLNRIQIPTKLDSDDFNHALSHTRNYNGDYYKAVDFVVVAESHVVYTKDEIKPRFITEKIMKCIQLDKPFILLGSSGLLKYIKEQAKIILNKDISHLTDWCDTSYDEIEDVWERIDKIANIIKESI